jgi:hypothetical protein
MADYNLATTPCGQWLRDTSIPTADKELDGDDEAITMADYNIYNSPFGQWLRDTTIPDGDKELDGDDSAITMADYNIYNSPFGQWLRDTSIPTADKELDGDDEAITMEDYRLYNTAYGSWRRITGGADLDGEDGITEADYVLYNTAYGQWLFINENPIKDAGFSFADFLAYLTPPPPSRSPYFSTALNDIVQPAGMTPINGDQVWVMNRGTIYVYIDGEWVIDFIEDTAKYNAYAFSVDAPVLVATANELQSWLDSGASKIELTEDITVSTAINVTHSVIIDGNGRTLTSTAGGNTTASIFINGLNGGAVTIKNLNLIASTQVYSRGINFENTINSTLNVENVTISNADYAVRIKGGSGATVNINGLETIDTWASINVSAGTPNAHVYVENSILRGHNEHDSPATTGGYTYAVGGEHDADTAMYNDAWSYGTVVFTSEGTLNFGNNVVILSSGSGVWSQYDIYTLEGHTVTKTGTYATSL